MSKYKILTAAVFLILFSLSMTAYASSKNKKQMFAQQESLVQSCISQNKYDEARGICLKLLECENAKLQKKQKYQIYMHLMDIYKNTNDFNSAIEICKEAEFLYPKNILPKITLGDIYMQNILYENAKNKYKEALLIDKNSRHANIKIADIYAMQGDFDLAYEHYKAAQNIQQDVSTSIKMAKAAIELGFVDKAVTMLEEIYKTEINDDIAVTLAGLYKEHGRFKDAEKTLLTALETCGNNNIELSLNLASLYILFRHYDMAKDILLSVKTEFPDIETVDFLLAETYYHTSDKEKARKLLKNIIKTTKSEYIKRHSQNMLNTYK